MACTCNPYNSQSNMGIPQQIDTGYPLQNGVIKSYGQGQATRQGMMPAQTRNIQTRTAGTRVTTGEMPPLPTMPVTPETPSTVQNPYYSSGFLRNFIGRDMRVEFLIGTSGALVDRVGTLLEVGASYIVLRPTNSDDLLMCDLYSIRFVTIFG